MPTDGSTVFASNFFPSTHWVRLLIALLMICYAMHLLQGFSPLRIDGDGIDYLTAAAAAADGKDLLALNRANLRPLGYPLMIAALDRMRIARPWSLVALNCGWLLLGLLASYAVSRMAYQLGKPLALLTCLLTVLSFSVTKHTPLVASDIPYFGLSLASLAAFEGFESAHGKVSQQIAWLSSGIFLLIAATLTRSIGITLLPALGWSLVRVCLVRRPLLNDKRIVIGSMVVAAVAITTWWGGFTRSYYGGLFIESYRDGLVQTLRRIAFMRLKQLGEVALNIPLSKFPAAGSVSWIVGSIVLILLFLGLWRRRRSPSTTDVYLLSCLAGLLLTPWTGGTGRYPMPVLPIVIAAILAELQLRWNMLRWARWAVCGMGALYLTMGAVAIGYSTWLTFSGAKFPERYGDGRLTPTYRLFLLHQPPARSEDLNPAALEVLRRYGGH